MGGPDRNYFGLGDSLGTGLDTSDSLPVATETFSIAAGTTVHGFGESCVGFDKAGQTIDAEVDDAMGVNTPRMYKPVPFFVTTDGYGAFAHTTASAAFWVGSRSANEVRLAVDDDVLDYFVFLGSVRQVLTQYTALTGRAPMPPDWTFGWWQSGCTYVSAEETLAAVRGLRDAGFPVDVIHLDTFWFAKDWQCDLEFARDRFPDPRRYCDELRELGVHLLLWHLPYLVTGTRLHDRLAAVDGFVRDPAGAPYDVGIHFVEGYDGPVHVIDWTNDAAVRVMRGEYRRLFDTGASVVKVDFGEDAPVDSHYADGTTGRRMHNRYPLLYQAAVHAAAEDATGERMAWVRAAWAGAQRYPVHWGGDAPPDWDMLLPQLHGALSLGLSGFTFWSTDIGGTADLPEDELLIRWLQLGLLQSHARVHGEGVREPHRWSQLARDVARRWIALRYRLLPYILGTASASAEAGLPFARRLVLDFQSDPTTWRIGDEYLFGEALLVAPLLERVPTGREMAHIGALATDPLAIRVAPFSGEGVTTFSNAVRRPRRRDRVSREWRAPRRPRRRRAGARRRRDAGRGRGGGSSQPGARG